jgi:cytoskeletal protein CcmA (bactofilin family)
MSGFFVRARKAWERSDQIRDEQAEAPKALKVAPKRAPAVARKKSADNGQAEEASAKAASAPMHLFQPKREPTTYLSKGVHFEGVIRSECSVHVDGQVKGRIEAPDSGITIGAGGKVEAELVADRVSVGGLVVGSVVARGRLEVRSTGGIQGDVRTGRLVMQEGGLLSGALHMEPPAKANMRELPPRSPDPRPAPAAAEVRRTPPRSEPT